MPLVAHLVRSHWKALTLAFLAVLGETPADILEPWPVKVVIDNVLQHKALPHRFDAIVALFPQNDFATLNFALAGVLLIAVIGAISSYSEKFLTTSVAQWVAHDLRRMVYQRIQRLSLAEHGESRTGDLLTRVTSDIDAVQDFITSALLGIVINILTLVGMLSVMFYMNWRFTLIGLSVAPVMFLFVYVYRSGSRRRRGCQETRRRADVRRRGKADVDPGGAGVRARGLRGSAVRLGEPAERGGGIAGAQHEGPAGADGRHAGRRRHLPRARLWRATGAGRRIHHRRAGHLHLLSRQDLQADERSLEDEQHGREGDDQLRAHSGAPRHGEPGPRSDRTRAPHIASTARWSSTPSPSATTASTRS